MNYNRCKCGQLIGRPFHICKSVWNKGLKGINQGIFNGMWKGDKVSRGALHDWVCTLIGESVS